MLLQLYARSIAPAAPRAVGVFGLDLPGRTIGSRSLRLAGLVEGTNRQDR